MRQCRYRHHSELAFIRLLRCDSQAVVVRARRELERVAEAGRQESEIVERLRSEFEQEKAAMQQVQDCQRTRVELDVGGVRHVTSVATLRSRPGSMLDALFSGRYNIEEEEGSGVFLDRDGSVFGHVLTYLRDMVAAGCEHEVSMLERVKREFGYYCIEVVEDLDRMFVFALVLTVAMAGSYMW